MPAYQAIRTLPSLLEGVERWGVPIIVIDDGSTDGTLAFLEQWSSGSLSRASDDERSSLVPQPPTARHVIRRAENGGKAAALRDGFARALELGFDAAVTIDSDGQHDPDNGARLLERFVELGGRAIVCGERSAATPEYPLRNLAGRRLNDLAIRAQTGVPVSDCPCGLRVYPLQAVKAVRCMSGRFAWEEEFLTRAIWAGFVYERVAIRCIYQRAPDGTRSSHYRFMRDWPEGIGINLWLTGAALCPPVPSKHALRRLAAQMMGAMSLRRAWEQLAGDAPARLHGAASMAVGALSALGAVGLHVEATTRGAIDASSKGSLMAAPELAAGAALVAAWIVVRLHGAMALALIGFGIAVAAGAAARRVFAPLMGAESDLAGAGVALAAVVCTALLLLLAPSIRVLRRRG